MMKKKTGRYRWLFLKERFWRITVSLWDIKRDIIYVPKTMMKWKFNSLLKGGEGELVEYMKKGTEEEI